MPLSRGKKASQDRDIMQRKCEKGVLLSLHVIRDHEDEAVVEAVTRVIHNIVASRGPMLHLLVL